jgi:tetratricopeptide (TPR) repeat protein
LGIDKEKIMGIAQRFIFKGQPGKAIKEYLKLIEASPKDKRLHLKLGDLYQKNRESEKAVKEYLQVADLFAEEDLNSRAISIYKKALSLDPNLIEAYHRIAKLYLKEGLVGNAKNYFQSILKIKPDDQEALKALGTFKEQQPGEQNRPSSSSPFSSPSSFSSSQWPSRNKLDEAEVDLSSPSSDISGSSPGGEASPPDKESEMHYHLGIAYKEMELIDYAVSEFELALSDPPLTSDCYIMLGECHMEKADYDQSIRYYKMAAEAKGLPDGKMAHVQFSLGLAYEARGMIPEAIEAFRAASILDKTLLEASEKVRQLQAMEK